MISAIIPTYRNPKCLDICLHSALKGKSDPSTEVICVVDGFVDESRDVIEKYKSDVKFLKLTTNSGMQRALNLGVMNSTGSSIFIVNDDNVFPEDWDTILMSELSKKNVDIVTANQIERGPSIFNFNIADYGDPETFNYEAFVSGEKEFRHDRHTNDGSIFPFGMSKHHYMMLGGFDELYRSPFVCDWDFFLKCELAGLKSIRTHNMNLYHFGSVSTKNSSEGERFKASERAAENVFKYKWGIDPVRHSNNSHKPNVEFYKGVDYAR